MKNGSSKKCVLGLVDEEDLGGEIASLAVAVRVSLLDFDFVVQSFQGTAAYVEQQPVENVPTMGYDGHSEPCHRTNGRGASLQSPIVQVLAFTSTCELRSSYNQCLRALSAPF